MTDRALRSGLTVLVWVGFLLLPLVVDEWYLSSLAQLIAYGIFAMSLAFVWGQVGLLCFGQAIFFGTGAYVMALITKGMLAPIPDATPLGLLAAIVLPALLANLLGQFLFRGRGVSGAYFAIVTLSAAVIAERLAGHWRFIGGFNGLLGVPPLRLGFGADATELFAPLPVYYVMLAAAALVFLGAALAGARAARLGAPGDPRPRGADRLLRLRRRRLQAVRVHGFAAASRAWPGRSS